MSIVAGVDFGTLSVRVSIFDSERGRLGAGVGEYPLLRKKEDPDHATQSHADHMRALVEAMHRAVEDAGVDGQRDRGDGARHHRIERDSGGCESRAARRLLPVVRSPRLEGSRRDYRGRAPARIWKRSIGAAASTHPSGASRSCCTGCGTIRKSGRASPPRSSIATWWRRCCAGSPIPAGVPRSVCAMGHKWMWNAGAGRAAARRVPAGRRSAADRCTREN